jgi:hypothetical protein
VRYKDRKVVWFDVDFPPGFQWKSVSCIVCGIREKNLGKLREFLGEHAPHIEKATRGWKTPSPVKIVGQPPGDPLEGERDE